MHAANGNGSLPATSALDVVETREVSPLDAYLERTRQSTRRIADELAQLRDDEQQLCDELTKQASEARARVKGYEQAITALNGSVGKVKTQPAPKRPNPKRGDWQISDARVDEIEARVRELLVGETKALTGAYLADRTPGVSPETARRGLNVLREREVLRVAGSSQGGGVLFALMPEGDSAD